MVELSRNIEALRAGRDAEIAAMKEQLERMQAELNEMRADQQTAKT